KCDPCKYQIIWLDSSEQALVSSMRDEVGSNLNIDLPNQNSIFNFQNSNLTSMNDTYLCSKSGVLPKYLWPVGEIQLMLIGHCCGPGKNVIIVKQHRPSPYMLTGANNRTGIG
ncbi:unnamed protein product, partial [Meganyctiphanes norvegica]